MKKNQPLFDVYLLDANAIRSINYSVLQLKKQQAVTMTIEDVRREVASLDKIELLFIGKLEANAYEKMGELMINYPVVRNLVDYVENKGAADVAVLSFILTMNEGKLIEESVCVVTADKNLRIACDELGINWISSEEFTGK